MAALTTCVERLVEDMLFAILVYPGGMALLASNSLVSPGQGESGILVVIEANGWTEGAFIVAGRAYLRALNPGELISVRIRMTCFTS